MSSRLQYAALSALTVFFLAPQTQAQEPSAVSFRKDIAPLLLDNCLACHGPKKAEGGYRVDTYERLTSAGDSAAPGFVAKDVESSEAFRRMVSDDPAERMPLEGDPLPADQIELFRRWIDEGASYDAEDPKANLASIVPPMVYARGPEAYAYAMPITALTFSADGQQLFSSGYHEILAWNPVDGSLIRRLENVGQRTLALAVSPDGQLLAAAGGTPGKLGETRIFEVASGQLKSVVGTTTDVVMDVAFHPQGDRIALAGADNMVRVIEVATGKELLSITSHSDWVMAVAWNSDGTKLVTGSRDKTSKVFDAATGELLVTYSGHAQPVKGVAFHPEGAEVYSSGADNKIHRWKIADGMKTSEIGFGGEVFRLTRSDTFLLAASADKSLWQYNAQSQEQVRQYAGQTDWVLTSAMHPATKRVAAGSFNGEIRVWNSETGEQVVAFFAAPGYHPPAAQP